MGPTLSKTLFQLPPTKAAEITEIVSTEFPTKQLNKQRAFPVILQHSTTKSLALPRSKILNTSSSTKSTTPKPTVMTTTTANVSLNGRSSEATAKATSTQKVTTTV